MTHVAWVRRWLGQSLRIKLGALVLALMVLPAIFAELIAADAPVFASGASGVLVLPAIVQPAQHRGLSPTDIAALHADDFAVWPLVRYGPATTDTANAAISSRHPLGTDAHGQDLLARVVYGARTCLGLALVAVLLALIFGVLFGAIAGYAGGFWDEMLARPAEFIETFPAVIIVAIVRAVDPEQTALSLLFAVAAVRWAEIARLVRAEVARISTTDHVTAARALGCSPARILRRHVMPMALRPVIVSCMFGVGSVVLLEAAVSFLGMGLEGSWGVMLAEAMTPDGGMRAPICAIAMMTLTVASSYLLADALEEKLDARVATTAR